MIGIEINKLTKCLEANNKYNDNVVEVITTDTLYLTPELLQLKAEQLKKLEVLRIPATGVFLSVCCLRAVNGICPI